MVLSFGSIGNPFWAREVQALEKIQQKYKDRRLVVVGIALDQDKGAVKEWAKKQNITFPVAVELPKPQGVERYQVSALPTTFVLDPAHKIVYRFAGFNADLEKALTEAVEKATAN